MARDLEYPTLLKTSTQDRPSTSQQHPMDALFFSPPVEILGGLDPYSGEWNQQTARHLLKRAMFAPNATQIQEAVDFATHLFPLLEMMRAARRTDSVVTWNI